MKKIFYALFILMTISATAQSSFGPVEMHGFGAFNYGYGYNPVVNTIRTFQGNIYVGMGNDSGYVFRSSTGDLGSFTKVYNATGSANSVKDLEVSSDGSKMFGITYYNSNAPARVIVTANGTNWTNFYQAPDNNTVISDVTLYSASQTVDSVYVAIVTSTGNNVVIKNALDANDPDNTLGTWDTVSGVLDPMSTVYPGSVTVALKFNNKIYYSTGYNHLFETVNGTSIIENTSYSNIMGNTSPSYPVSEVDALEVYNGYMYLGGTNGSYGAQLWRTADGVTYDSLGVADPNFFMFASLKSVGGKLFMVIKDYYGGYKIVSTVDGSSFTTEDSTEFGNTNTDAQYGAPMEIFNNHLYLGVREYNAGFRLNGTGGNHVMDYYSNGGQVHRTCLNGPMPALSIVGGDTAFACAGVTVTLTATGGPTYTWSTGSTGSSISSSVTGEYDVTTVDANSCRNSLDAYIMNYYGNPVNVLDNMGGVAYNGVVCSGDTSVPYYASDPDHDYSCLIARNDSGLVSAGQQSFSASDMTVEFWLNPTGNYGTILMESDGNSIWSGDSALLYLDYNSLYFYMPGMGGAPQYVGYIGSGYWTHLAIRYTNSLTKADLFINGNASATINNGYMHTPPSAISGVDVFKFMDDTLNYYPYTTLSGKLRDVRIWNVAKTDSAIAADMHGITTGSHPGLIYYYELKDGSGTIAADSSGNGSAYNGLAHGIFDAATTVNWGIAPGMMVTGFNTAIFYNSTPATYGLSYTNSHGCLVVDSFKVEPARIWIEGYPKAACGGNAAYLNINGNLSYDNTVWYSPIDTVYGYSASYNPVDSILVVAVDSVAGCGVLKDSLMVKAGPSFNSNIFTAPAMSTCANTSVWLHADASGGTAPYNFTWYDYTTGDTAISHVDSIYFNISAGSHNIGFSGVDAIGCTLSADFNGYNVTGIQSTDLTGFVTTSVPSPVDNGVVYLFRHHPGSAGYDTVQVNGIALDVNGQYIYSSLDAGDYLIKAIPDASAFPLASPTYYGNTFQWDSSLVYTHGCVQTDTANIQVVEMDGTTGIASISGYITEGGPGFGEKYGNFGNTPNLPFVPGGPLKGIDVKLGKNPSGGIQARTTSDSIQGFYQFLNVPAGSYKIYVDIPNLPMDSTRLVDISPTDSSVQNNYYVDSAHIYIDTAYYSVGITNNKVYDNKFVVYPNPAKSTIYLNYELSAASKVSFEIVNSLGQPVAIEPQRNYPKGKNMFVMDLNRYNLPGGVYFISLISEGNRYTQRLVIIE